LKVVDLEITIKHLQNSIDTILKNSEVVLQSDFTAFSKVEFNQTYLESILLNLITNAIKYAHPDRLPIISISTRILDNRKQLIISDNGSGFDLDHVRGKIFGLHETFHQHKDSKGIGLYLVHKHITDLGGEIHLESKLNEGSSFIITFKH
jgi:signal transduction histidine kinase